MRLGHIGARAGSKGVPGKNFMEIAGKPLIDWSLDHLFDAPEIDAVVVSTDCPDIYAHAVARGTLPIGLRPAHLATDGAGKWEVWQHALAASVDQIGEVSMFLDVDCTAPLRELEDIAAAVALFEAERPDMVMTCCEAEKNPYFNLLELDENGSLSVSKPLPGGVVARQQAPMVYEHGCIYVLDPDYLRRADRLFAGRVLPSMMPAERAIDIDSPFDLQIVRFLMESREEAKA